MIEHPFLLLELNHDPRLDGFHVAFIALEGCDPPSSILVKRSGGVRQASEITVYEAHGGSFNEQELNRYVEDSGYLGLLSEMIEPRLLKELKREMGDEESWITSPNNCDGDRDQAASTDNADAPSPRDALPLRDGLLIDRYLP